MNKTCPPWGCNNIDWILECLQNKFFDALSNFTEFNVALENANINSSLGIDGNDYEIYKNEYQI
jgi:hypothetical protein